MTPFSYNDTLFMCFYGYYNDLELNYFDRYECRRFDTIDDPPIKLSYANIYPEGIYGQMPIYCEFS
jgi:hypothetical protein